MDDEIQQPQKISFAVGVLGMIVAILFDILSLIPGVGDIEGVPAGVIIVLNFIAGMGGTVLIVQGLVTLLKLIPGLQEIPLWTPAWSFTWWTENHPSKLTALVEKAGDIAAELEGAGAEGELGKEAEGAGTNRAGANSGQQGTSRSGSAEQGGDAAAGTGTGTNGAGSDARPSEKSTERGSEDESKGSAGRGRNDTGEASGQGDEEDNEPGAFGESEEQRKRERAQQQYDELTPQEERSPMDIAREKDFALQEGSQRTAQEDEDAATTSENSSRDKEETVSARLLRERNERKQREANQKNAIEKPKYGGFGVIEGGRDKNEAA